MCLFEHNFIQNKLQVTVLIYKVVQIGLNLF
jgi:hypothetical protein